MTAICTATIVTWALLFHAPHPPRHVPKQFVTACYQKELDCESAAGSANQAFMLDRSKNKAECLKTEARKS